MATGSVSSKRSAGSDVKRQIVIYLYTARVYHILQITCKKAYDSLVSKRHREKKLNCETNEEPNFEQDIGFPDLSSFLDWYEKFANLYMIYIIARGLLPLDFLTDALNLTKPLNCFLPGRFILIEKRSNLKVALLISMCHLGYRYWVRYRCNMPILNMIMFMILDKNVIKRYENLTIHDLGNQLSVQDKFVSSILCREKIHNGRIIHQVRCNRDFESYITVCQMVREVTVKASIVFSVISAAIGTILLVVGTRKEWYFDEYPNCNLQLQHANPEPSHWEVLISSHRLAMMPFDIIENFIIWFDSMCAVILVLSLVYLLNYDMTLYWSHLQRRLVQLNKRLKYNWFFRHDPRARQQIQQYRRMTLANKFLGPPSQLYDYDHEDEIIENLIVDLQWEISDFFNQFHNADSLVSPAITAGYIVWFLAVVIFAYDSYIFSQATNLDYHWIPYSALGVISSITFALITFNRKTKKTYDIICSLMFYDQSHRKLGFLSLLEYYTHYHKAAYTLFNGRLPLDAAAYLSIVSYTFSCVFIIHDLITS